MAPYRVTDRYGPTRCLRRRDSGLDHFAELHINEGAVLPEPAAEAAAVLPEPAAEIAVVLLTEPATEAAVVLLELASEALPGPPEPAALEEAEVRN